jgi:hypothetical protein
MRRGLLALAALLAASPPLYAQAPAPPAPSRITFAAGTSQATVSGTVKGDDSKSYVLGAKAGQTLKITFVPSKGVLYYNVIDKTTGEALRTGSMESEPNWTGSLPSTGDYVLDVYFMRNEARRGTSATYRLTVDISNGGR